MGITPQQHEQLKANLENKAGGKHHVIQKQQADVRSEGTPPNANNRSDKAKKKRSDHAQYRISVTFRISDNRVRDLDGMLTTILDALIDARGRLAAVYSKHSH